MEWRKDGCRISDRRDSVDENFVIERLRDTYWAADRDPEVIRRTLDTSVNFSLLEGGRQIAYARVVTDYATFAWICDVVVDPESRGRGLGKWLMACVLDHPACKVGSCWLATRDAHGLYARFGFREIDNGMRLRAEWRPGPGSGQD